MIPPDAVLTPRPDALPAWDSLSDSEKRALRAADGGLRRLPGERRLERRAAARRGRGDGRARQHARDLHLRRQRREPGGHDHRLVQRADDAERDRADARAAALADRQIRRARRLGHRRVRAALRDAPGRGRATRRSSGASRSPRTSAAPATAWSSPGRSGSGTPAACAPSSPTASTSGRRSSKRPASPSPRWSTGSRRSRWRGRASCTASTTRTRPSGTPCSTSRSSATGRSTRTAGGPPASSTASPGTLSPPTMARFAPGTYDPEQDTWELYYLPDDFTPGERPRRGAPGEARRAQGALLGGGREAQRAAAAGRRSRSSSGSCRRCRRSRRTRSTATSRTSPPG